MLSSTPGLHPLPLGSNTSLELAKSPREAKLPRLSSSVQAYSGCPSTVQGTASPASPSNKALQVPPPWPQSGFRISGKTASPAFSMFPAPCPGASPKGQWPASPAPVPTPRLKHCWASPCRPFHRLSSPSDFSIISLPNVSSLPISLPKGLGLYKREPLRDDLKHPASVRMSKAYNKK